VVAVIVVMIFREAVFLQSVFWPGMYFNCRQPRNTAVRDFPSRCLINDLLMTTFRAVEAAPKLEAEKKTRLQIAPQESLARRFWPCF